MPSLRDAPQHVKDEGVAKVQRELAELLHPRWNTRWNILRWLQDHEYDADATVQSLRRHLKYRRERFLDEDMRGLQRSIVCEQYHPLRIVGPNRVKGGDRLLVFDQPGRTDVHGLMQSVQPTQFLHHMYRGVEEGMRRLSEMEAEVNDQCYFCYIYDMEGLRFDPSMIKISTGPFRIAWELTEFQYREFVDKIIIINAPAFLNIFLAALWPFLPDRHRKRIHVCDKNYQEYLLSIADAERIPTRYGGTLRDHDIIDIPKKVPKSWYARVPSDYPKPEQLHEITIPPGKTRCIDLLLQPWTTMGVFSTNDSDVQFWLYYAANKADLEDEAKAELLLPTATLTSIPMIDYFDYVAEREGHYQIRMKNHSTWFANAHIGMRVYDQNRKEIPFLNKDEHWIKLSTDHPKDLRVHDWARENPNNPNNNNKRATSQE